MLLDAEKHATKRSGMPLQSISSPLATLSLSYSVEFCNNYSNPQTRQEPQR